jgi:hypothetical protein
MVIALIGSLHNAYIYENNIVYPINMCNYMSKISFKKRPIIGINRHTLSSPGLPTCLQMGVMTVILCHLPLDSKRSEWVDAATRHMAAPTGQG